MPDPSTTQRAVFLSYAREDAGAARRIAEALRASGVEVWFDENELRGGDAWDAKIRRQIGECALFVPLVSAHTQERGKGYFRLEWKLAVEQTHLMAAGMTFLMPVVVDATAENGAIVPPEFMAVQWTRLPDGLPTPQFTRQVKQLLDNPRQGGAALAPASAAAATGAVRPRSNYGVPVTAATLVGAALAWYFWGRSAPTPTVPAPTVSKPEVVQAAKPAVYAKSIAVLPFENRSEDKGNAFFTDGIHEDILTNLAHIAELRVVSRTSVMEYRSTTKKIRQIGEELGVAWILEGSVQRAGNKVRVTGQLINARTDEHVWAQSYDRDLTDLFGIQAELAKEIAGALSATLSPQEQNLLARRPTANPAAYDLYLKARQINRDGNDTGKELETQVAMLESATALDPQFAAAWADLCGVHAQMISQLYDVSEARLAKARDAITTARKLAPDDPEVIVGTGHYYYYALRDYPAALDQYERIARQWPNDFYGPFSIALALRRQGKWVESLANLRRAELLDPASPEVARNIVISLRAMRRYDEAIVEQTRRVRLVPESLAESVNLALLHYQARGSVKEADEVLAGPIAERAGEKAVAPRMFWAATKGDLAAAARLDREFPGMTPLGNEWRPAMVLAAMGDLAGARARVEKAQPALRARLVNEPENTRVWSNLAITEALLGNKEAALVAARRAVELLPESRDALIGTSPRWALVVTEAWVGDKEAACAELSRLLSEPWNSDAFIAGVYTLKSAPWLSPLKGYPRFEALVNDPKNNAPLF